MRYFDVQYNNYKSQQATVHFCSRSLLVELVTDMKAPIYKYLFKNLTKEPILRNGHQLPLRLEASKIVTVPCN